VARFATLLVGVLVVAACAVASSPSASPSPASTAFGGAVSSSPETSPRDPTAGLAAELEAAGADVHQTGVFDTEPLGGQGVALCVDGQQVSVYAYATPDERLAVAARIDPTDPSNLGTSIIEWAGNPKFWQADRFIVLYLGNDPAVESGLTSVLGQPFARGQGRDPGPGRYSC
jgi:hypothetical protein